METGDWADRVRALALSWPETYEDEPWGHPVFKVADNRMFATMSEGDGVVRMSLKLTPEGARSRSSSRTWRRRHTWGATAG